MPERPTSGGTPGAPGGSISDRWERLQSLPFPDRIPRDVTEEIDLDLLDDESTRFIQEYLLLRALPPEAVGALHACDSQLRTIAPRLRGEAGEYFRLLQSITQDVLAHATHGRTHLA
jgi:hypothetical protein